MRRKSLGRKERGATVMEMSIAGIVLCLTLFGIIEFSRLMLTQNGLTDAVRRGARYAVINQKDETKVKNVTVFGVPTLTGGEKRLVTGLATSNVLVTYSDDFGVKQGTVTVRVVDYTFSFIVPLIGATIELGEYRTTLTGEAAGYIPPAL
jgi:Flp pilus assembly protein TadG